ncbi:unnamed protein product [Cylindrotheca closterium]|uniref:FH2 domain-containing protein n=1 Tax=Cylindrotheca closterium TaxID=2856 RepID=A0AAD2CW24_9STRA|nr:unnamed protein product [Cylindrotheca closterium]
MLNNLLGEKNVPAGIPKTIGEQNHNKHKEDTATMENTKQQRANARNALSNLLGARRKPPPSAVFHPKIAELGASLTTPATPTRKNGANKNASTDLNQNLPLKKDPRFEKYFRMLKVGMPLAHVKHAMQRDGINPDVMDQDHNKPANSGNKNETSDISMPKRQPRRRKRNSEPRRARFRWNKISNFFTESIWGDLSDDETIKSIDIDEEEFTELFQAQVVTEESTKQAAAAAAQQRHESIGGNMKKKKMGSAVRVIDAKRANNGGISLARIKMTFDQMSQTVEQMDISTLTAGQIENMIEYLPSNEEQERLTEYMLNVEQEDDLVVRFNSLCECEKFMVSMMTVKYRKEKLDSMHFKLDFQYSIDSIVQDADLVDKACDELRNSDRLKKLLGIVLELGNKLNTAAQGPEDKANAFDLDSLLKLKETKAFDKKTTFLNYIVSIVERNDESLLDFAQDIQTVIKAEKVYWDVCVSEIKEVETHVENLRQMALYEAKKEEESSIAIMNGSSTPKAVAAPNCIQVPEDEEFATLKSTSTGRFTIDALTQLSQLHIKVDATIEKFQNLLIYFGINGAGERSKRPHELFSIFSQFSRDFAEARPALKHASSFKRR